MLTCVDDIIVTGSNSNMISCLIHLLGKEFSLNDLESLHYFLGTKVLSRSDGLFLNQTKHALYLIDQEYMTNCKPVLTPLQPHRNCISRMTPYYLIPLHIEVQLELCNT